MGEPIKEIKHDDGWIDRAYWLNDDHTAYMVFGFHGEDSRCRSIQITGIPGYPMAPFLGFTLGAARDSVLERFGEPSSTKHYDDVNVDLYKFDGRNYTLEFDSEGLLYSIRIVGEEGFPRPSPDSTFTLQSLRSILAAQNVDSLLEILAGDIEVFLTKSDSLIKFTSSPRNELMNSQSSISQVLFGPKVSLLALLTQETITQAELNVRVTEKKGVGMVYKFPKSADITEIVLFPDTGRYRIWEISLNR